MSKRTDPANDPSGFKAAIAQIPEGQLSSRQQRIAAGVALIRSGKNIHAAAQAVQVPYSTLYRHNAGLTEPDHEKAFQQGERALVDGYLAIASLANENIFKRLEDEGNPMKDGDTIKASSMATDKIALKRGWARGLGSGNEKTQDALAGVLEQLQSGSQVQITKADPADKATTIEVEVIPVD